MNSNFVTYSTCANCDLTRVDQHPIPYCYGCDREAYEREFVELRKQRSFTHFLGYDPYVDCLYVWADGIVSAIEGRVEKCLRVRKVDDLVRRITDLETENKNVLAENARLRRRLEGKPSPSGGTSNE